MMTVEWLEFMHYYDKCIRSGVTSEKDFGAIVEVCRKLEPVWLVQALLNRMAVTVYERH